MKWHPMSSRYRQTYALNFRKMMTLITIGLSPEKSSTYLALPLSSSNKIKNNISRNEANAGLSVLYYLPINDKSMLFSLTHLLVLACCRKAEDSIARNRGKAKKEKVSSKFCILWLAPILLFFLRNIRKVRISQYKLCYAIYMSLFLAEKLKLSVTEKPEIACLKNEAEDTEAQELKKMEDEARQQKKIEDEAQRELQRKRNSSIFFSAECIPQRAERVCLLCIFN